MVTGRRGEVRRGDPEKREVRHKTDHGRNDLGYKSRADPDDRRKHGHIKQPGIGASGTRWSFYLRKFFTYFHGRSSARERIPATRPKGRHARECRAGSTPAPAVRNGITDRSL